jgi:hypothetical protein
MRRVTEIETLQEGIYIVTPEDQILDVNPALAEFSDTTQAIVGSQRQRGLPMKRYEPLFGRSQPPTGVGGPRNQTLRKDGVTHGLNTAVAVRDPSGKIIRYQGALMDITERREIERRLHTAGICAPPRRQLSDLILVLDTEAHYTFAVRGAAKCWLRWHEISEMKLEPAPTPRIS